MKINQQFIIDDTLNGLRFDQASTQLLSDFSRSRIQAWINEGKILLNERPQPTKYKVSTGETITVNVIQASNDEWLPQPVPIHIVYEDDSLLVIDKPAGLVVHPAAGNPDKTLINGLLYHDPELAKLPRAGLIHRLDKDTSGLLVIAKTLSAHTDLVKKLQDREVTRKYQALVYGRLTGGGKVDAAMGRHAHNRLKMAVRENGKPAITHYRILTRFSHFTLLDVQLETGRTHQIRVHMSHINHPIVGDPLYSRKIFPKGIDPALKEVLSHWKRQALHAYELALHHPVTQDIMRFESPLPSDFFNLLESIKTYCGTL